MKTCYKKGRIGLMTAAAACVISLIIMCAALYLYDDGSSEREKADFTPPPFDATAVQGTPEVPEGLGWSEIDAQVYRASICSVIIAEEGTADVWLTNPENNEVWLKLRLIDSSGQVLGETGIIRPGEYVQSVKLNTEVETGESVSMKLMGYVPETYYSAGSVTLNTSIEEEKAE